MAEKTEQEKFKENTETVLKWEREKAEKERKQREATPDEWQNKHPKGPF
jgi:hypothetical protein